MKDSEVQKEITQAIGAAITFCTLMWSHRIQEGQMPTQEEMQDVVVAATLSAWERIAPFLKDGEVTQ
jgi:hypothetical protein